MPRMDARIAPLRLTLGLAASARLAGLPGAAQETPAPAGAAHGLQHRDHRVSPPPLRRWRRDLERGGRRPRHHRRPMTPPAARRRVGHFVALLPASVWHSRNFRTACARADLRAAGHAAWSQTASSWGTRAGFALQRLGLNVPVSAARCFSRRSVPDLGVSLTYAMPSRRRAWVRAGYAFTLNESRRCASTNQLLRPSAFGVIALVTPARGESAGR